MQGSDDEEEAGKQAASGRTDEIRETKAQKREKFLCKLLNARGATITNMIPWNIREITAQN